MTPQFSVFTPSNNAEFLGMAYESLRAQTLGDWEWLVQPNGGIAVPEKIREDKRVRVLYDFEHEYVGALKRQACSAARGNILVELDHDDLLVPHALWELALTFEQGAEFVYSNAMHCDMKFKPVGRFGTEYGWKYRMGQYEDNGIEYPVSFAPTPASVARIWYAPNHVRAFTRALYTLVGGYNSGMRVLDDQDLMCRMYLQSPFKHVDKPLYVYRVHGGNSWLKHNKEIQDNVYRLYDQYIQEMALVHAKRSKLKALELGGSVAAMRGFETVDLKQGADIRCDLNGYWPWADSSVGVVRAYDVFEHLNDPLHVMKQLYRILAPGGMAFIQVPSTDGRGAFQDPTHKSFWNANSWLYYTHRNWAKYIDTPVRFQAVRSYTTEKNAQQVCWTVAHLISLKENYYPPGVINI